MATIKRLLNLSLCATLITAAVMLAGDALAQSGIPTPVLPQEAGGDQNNFLGAFWGWGRFLLQVFALLLGAFIAYVVIAAIGRRFGDVRRDDSTMADVIPLIGLGLLFLGVAALVLTIGWNIISNTSLTL